MPTAARLAAALLMAALAFVASLLIMPLLPEGTDFGYFLHYNVVLGSMVGWVYLGGRAGHGFVPSLNNGLTGMALLVLAALLSQGAWEMFRLAQRLRYDGPFEAVAAVFTIALEYFFVIAVPGVWAVLIIGGGLAGVLTERVWKRWP